MGKRKLAELKFVLPEHRVLLQGPENRTAPRLFVAATRQNEGKTTTCLGLFAALQKHFPKVGYIKPIGQRYVDVDGMMIDEDSVLLDSIYHVDAPIEAMSPIAIDPTFTRRYLTNPEGMRKNLVDRMCRAFDRTVYEKDAVIIEGSGHAGVGSVFDLSNAQVARILGAHAILISTGGIGRPVDEIALNKSLFDKFGVRVIGAIINKVQPDKIEIVREYTSLGLERLGVPLLAVLPEEKKLSAPNLLQIVNEVDGRWLNGRDHGMNLRIERVIIGAMMARQIVESFQPGVLIVTPGDRDDIILAAIASTGLASQPNITGIILTRDTIPHPRLMEMLSQTSIPVVLSSQDSYTVAAKIHAMTVKTQPQDSDKIPLIQKLILDNLDMPRLLDLLR